jgi:hypothetical protein
LIHLDNVRLRELIEPPGLIESIRNGFNGNLESSPRLHQTIPVGSALQPYSGVGTRLRKGAGISRAVPSLEQGRDMGGCERPGSCRRVCRHGLLRDRERYAPGA